MWRTIRCQGLKREEVREGGREWARSMVENEERREGDLRYGHCSTRNDLTFWPSSGRVQTSPTRCRHALSKWRVREPARQRQWSLWCARAALRGAGTAFSEESKERHTGKERDVSTCCASLSFQTLRRRDKPCGVRFCPEAGDEYS